MPLDTTESFIPTGSLVYVTFEDDYALQEKIKTKSGIELYIAPKYDREAYAKVSATVHSMGRKCDLPIQPGDEVILKYHVGADHTFNKDGGITYNRCRRVGDKVVWYAKTDEVIAVKRDEQWQAVGDWCILEEVEREVEEKVGSIYMPVDLMKGIIKGKGVLYSGKIDAPIGSTIYFNPDFQTAYRFPDGRIFIVLKADALGAYTI